MIVKLYRDGVRLGGLTVRWRVGRTRREPTLGAWICRLEGGDMRLAAGLWWMGASLEWWAPPTALIKDAIDTINEEPK